jgi:hypothetical protein
MNVGVSMNVHVWWCLFALALPIVSAEGEGGAPAPTGLHCDLVTHLGTKPYVENRSDLLGRSGPQPASGGATLRLVTVGVKTDDLRAAFRCVCTRFEFDAAGTQPHRSPLLALWTCPPDIEIAEFNDPSEYDGWGAAQWEEFETRVSGRAEWGQVLPRASTVGRFLGWHFGSRWTSVDDARPFAVYLDSKVAVGPHGARLNAAADTDRNIRFRGLWSASDVGKQLRRAMVRLAVMARETRMYARGRQSGLDERRASEDAALATCRNDLLAARTQLLTLFHKSAQGHTPAQGGSNGELGASAQVAAWTASLTCPLTMDVLVDPVINVQTGQTYSGAEIRRWVTEHGTDPVTRQPTTLADLVPNRVVRDLLHLLPQ